MATITKRQRKDKIKWQVRIRVSNNPPITKTLKLKSHAQAWAREIEIKIEKGLLTTGYDRSEETLGQVLERYLAEVTPKKRGQKVEKYRIKNSNNILFPKLKLVI